jgi:hypothetical protein
VRRTQVVIVQLRPGALTVAEGQLILDAEGGPFDVLGWVVQAAEPVEEP